MTEEALRALAAGVLRDYAAGYVDWDVMYGHEPSNPETEESHRVAGWFMELAHTIEMGRFTAVGT